MKKILYSLIVCAGVLTFAACDDSVEDNSRLTYLVDLQVEKATIEHQVNTEFTAPKFTATENGVDVSAKVTVKGLDKVNEDKIGIYPISYSVANSDGYLSTAKQTVYVVNAEADTDISGDYTIAIDDRSPHCIGSYCKKSDGTIEPFSTAYPLTVTKVATGIFTISDMLGGWMNLKEGKGTDFALSANYSLDESLDFTLTNPYKVSSGLSGLKDKLMMGEEGEEKEVKTLNSPTVTVISPATSTETTTNKVVLVLQWDVEYDGREIHVVATTEKKIESEE